MVNEGAKVLDTCTALMGLPDLASDGSPFFLDNTSTYCMLTLLLSYVNYALRGEFPSLHRLLQDIFTYALFWLPRVVFLKQTFTGTKVLMRRIFR